MLDSAAYIKAAKTPIKFKRELARLEASCKPLYPDYSSRSGGASFQQCWYDADNNHVANTYKNELNGPVVTIQVYRAY